MTAKLFYTDQASLLKAELSSEEIRSIDENIDGTAKIECVIKGIHLYQDSVEPYAYVKSQYDNLE